MSNRGKINPWTLERLKEAEKRASPLKYIVEVQPDARELVKGRLRIIQNVSIISQPADRFIVVEAPSEALPAIEAIPQVVKISSETAVWIKEFPLTLPPLATSKFDPWVGTVSLSPVEVEAGPVEGIATLPLMAVKSLTTKVYTTEYTKKYLEVPDDNKINTKVAVLDTGLLWPHTLMRKTVHLKSFVPEEPSPLDGQGHGCLSSITKVYTSICGLRTLDRLWEEIDATPIRSGFGEYKLVRGKTMSRNGVADIVAVYRERVSEKVVIRTKYGVWEATPWHKFYVVAPVKRPRNRLGNYDGHPRWYWGFEVVEKEARDLKPGDALLLARYRGESWGEGSLSHISYLHGLATGDGMVMSGEFYHRKRHELRLYDESYEFLSKVQEKYGGRLRKSSSCYELYIYGELVDEIARLKLADILKDLEAFRAWMAGFFDAEGNIETRRARVRVINTNRELLETVRDVLRICGVWCYISSGGVSKGSRSYHLCITDVEAFRTFVSPYIMKRTDLFTAPVRRASRGILAHGDTFMLPVRDVLMLPTDEYFYDLSTTEHNYSAHGVITHNTWCSTCAFGDSATHPRYGRCLGIADPKEQMHGKVLSNAGFGMTSWILDGMYYAVKKYGARVVSMSLGGELQGTVDDDPMCRLIASLKDEAIFVVAAGNEGPEQWTIGSPGAAPDALTVGSWGITANKISEFSSRGASGKFYKDHPEAWGSDYVRFGDDLIKPDLVAPGGDSAVDEKILSGCAGWYDPIGDVLPQWAIMRGTSMATPHAAGVVALAYDRGLVATAADVKAKLRETWAGVKSKEVGYGLLNWKRLTQ